MVLLVSSRLWRGDGGVESCKLCQAAFSTHLRHVRAPSTMRVYVCGGGEKETDVH